MTEAKAQKEQPQKKVAPNIAVGESLGKRPIDKLLADNPDQEFVRVPIGATNQALAKRGMELVTQGGEAVTRKGYAVARCVDSTHQEKVEAQHEEAEETIAAVRDLELSDAQAYEKKVKQPRKKRASKKSS